MTAASSVPLSRDVAGAFAVFWHGGDGPSHTVISRVLTSAGYFDGYEYKPDVPGPNKAERVLRAFREAEKRPARGRDLLEGLLSALRVAGLVGTGDRSEAENTLRRALGGSGWYLTDEGQLRPFLGVDLSTGGREALDVQVDRLRRSTEDPALLIGTAKEMLESVAKFVLEELGYPTQANMDFSQLWHLARERLWVLPQQVDPDLPGAASIQAIHESTWRIAQHTNTLRNLQGTGHGRTLPSGVSEELALLVVREATSVAEYMLVMLDKAKG
ncbi:abortive infection family protein [Phycicoccus ginsengisoli]